MVATGVVFLPLLGMVWGGVIAQAQYALYILCVTTAQAAVGLVKASCYKAQKYVLPSRLPLESNSYTFLGLDTECKFF